MGDTDQMTSSNVFSGKKMLLFRFKFVDVYSIVNSKPRVNDGLGNGDKPLAPMS